MPSIPPIFLPALIPLAQLSILLMSNIHGTNPPYPYSGIHLIFINQNDQDWKGSPWGKTYCVVNPNPFQILTAKNIANFHEYVL